MSTISGAERLYASYIATERRGACTGMTPKVQADFCFHRESAADRHNTYVSECGKPLHTSIMPPIISNSYSNNPQSVFRALKSKNVPCWYRNASNIFDPLTLGCRNGLLCLERRSGRRRGMLSLLQVILVMAVVCAGIYFIIFSFQLSDLNQALTPGGLRLK